MTDTEPLVPARKDSETIRLREPVIGLPETTVQKALGRFQSKSPDSPGYLTKEKMADHVLNSAILREKQRAMRLLTVAGIDADSTIAAETLLAGGVNPEIVQSIQDMASRQKKVSLVSEEDKASKQSRFEAERAARQIIIDGAVEKAPDDSMYMTQEEYRELEKKQKSKLTGDSVCVCQRCFRLQQYGQVDEALRPGWSDNELLSPERFESVLGVIKDTNAVVLCLVDVFDLQGSLLPNLRTIAGPNPIIIAANKIDLLPSDVSIPRITDWIHQEIKEVCNLQSPKETTEARQNRGQETTVLRRSGREVVLDGRIEENGILRRNNIHLVSCSTGFGMDELMANVSKQAVEYGNKVFVMGAANVGKSSFINRLLQTKYSAIIGKKQVNRRTQLDEFPLATVSNLPGTTLDLLKIKLPSGMTMIDTPGLLNKGQLTARLSPGELKQVIPKKQVHPATLRVEEGKCVLAGGLAMFELTEGRPFHFTFFMSNEVVLHPTSSDKAQEFIQRHVGTPLLTPPHSLERLQALEPSISHDFEIESDSWERSSYDIVVAGLGWVAISGPGVAKVRVTVPEGTSVGIRPSLMPFEATTTTVNYTGGRLSRKSKKNLPGPGWRA
eukprot:gene22584-28717_t